MLAAVTDRTRLIFVCNPNNPTSTVVDPDSLARFVESVPSHILIAIDEAYVEYIRDGMTPDSLGLVRSYSNVVVLRTFSKAYGLAGLRVGYAVGDPQVITALNKVSVPFTTTNVSQAAAIASLEAADELLARTDAVVAERTRVSELCATPGSPCRRRRRTSSGCRSDPHAGLRGAGRRITRRRPPLRQRRRPGHHWRAGRKRRPAGIRKWDLDQGDRDE